MFFFDPMRGSDRLARLLCSIRRFHVSPTVDRLPGSDLSVGRVVSLYLDPGRFTWPLVPVPGRNTTFSGFGKQLVAVDSRFRWDHGKLFLLSSDAYLSYIRIPTHVLVTSAQFLV